MNKEIRSAIKTNFMLFLYRPIYILMIFSCILFAFLVKLILQPYEIGITQIILISTILVIISGFLNENLRNIFLCAKVSRKDYLISKFFLWIIVYFISIILSGVLDGFVLLNAHYNAVRINSGSIISEAFGRMYFEVYPIYFLISAIIFGILFNIDHIRKSKILGIILIGPLSLILLKFYNYDNGIFENWFNYLFNLCNLDMNQYLYYIISLVISLVIIYMSYYIANKNFHKIDIT